MLISDQLRYEGNIGLIRVKYNYYSFEMKFKSLVIYYLKLKIKVKQGKCFI